MSKKPTKSRKKTKSLYICVLKLLSSATCLSVQLYMCDPSILLLHQPHQISQPLAAGQTTFIVDFPHCESKYSQRSSFVQKSFAAAIGICPFSTFLHLLKRGPNRPAITLYPIEREVNQLVCCILLLC